ncbi:MAG: GNAT family N-acetyltransferase, partial [Calditrichaeota bacterium]|nr:GNAT family N-acetyltransferase [Calditrichota bacterium]
MDKTDCERGVIASGDKVILRDYVPTDIDSIIHWNFHGEHLKFDAPWEHVNKKWTDEQIANFREGFLERISQKKTVPRGNVIIASMDNVPIGSVNKYFQKDIKDAPLLGISIKEDEYLNQGLGTEALKLWLDYQFANSDCHRIGAETWSFNP